MSLDHPLRRLLKPDWVVPGTLAELPLAALLERPSKPIRALVLDVDRTLLPRRQTLVPESMRLWLQAASQQVPIHLLSNNPSRHRIGAVAALFNLPFTNSAGKPRRTALRRVLAELELPASQVALIGDRLFTVLVKPIDPNGQPCQRDRLQKMELRIARWMGTKLT